MGDFIDDVAESDIIAIDNDRRTDCTVWGDIMTQYAGLRRITATVIDGVCHDVAKALGDGYPLFTGGRFMRTGKDRVEVAANACWPWCRGPELKVSNLVRTGRSSAKIGRLHSAMKKLSMPSPKADIHRVWFTLKGTGRSSVPTGDGDEAAAQQPLSIGATVHSRPRLVLREFCLSAR